MAASGSARPSPPEAAVLGPRLLLSLIAVLFVAKGLAFALGRADAVDFDCFHTAGRLAWAGRLPDAYGFHTMLPAMLADHGGRGGFLPFTYPPPFALLMTPLGALPTGLAYVLFAGTSLLAYLWVLRRTARPGDAGQAVAIALPAVVVNLACGQNGLLTGALVGAALLAGTGRRDAAAGAASGLMIVKPHLAAALAVHALWGGRWRWAATAVATAAAAAILSWAVFGAGAWTAFLHGAQEASAFLRARMYPLFRMVSVYASLRSVYAPEAVALAAQAAVAIAVLAATARLAVVGPPRRAAGFAAVASVLVSPYAYDYDMTIFAVGLVMLRPDLERFASQRGQTAIYALSAFPAFYGMMAAGLMHALHTVQDDLRPAPAPGGLAVALAAGLVWRALRRDPVAKASRVGRPSGHARSVSRRLQELGHRLSPPGLRGSSAEPGHRKIEVGR